MLAEQDALPAGGGAAELHRRFDRLGAGIAEEQLFHAGEARQQALGEQAAQQRDVHLHQVRQLGCQGLLQGADHRRMVAPDREDAEAAQQVEIAIALLVVEIGAEAPGVVAVEADGAQHADHLRIQIAVVELVFLRRPFGQELVDVDRHHVVPTWRRKSRHGIRAGIR